MAKRLKRGITAALTAPVLAIAIFPGVAAADTESKNGYKKCPPGQSVVIFTIGDATGDGRVVHGWTTDPPGPHNPWHTRTYQHGIHQTTRIANNEAWWFVTATTAPGRNPLAMVSVSCE